MSRLSVRYLSIENTANKPNAAPIDISTLLNKNEMTKMIKLKEKKVNK
jgi:hypothetical protein